jgi:hypothetical protein
MLSVTLACSGPLAALRIRIAVRCIEVAPSRSFFASSSAPRLLQLCAVPGWPAPSARYRMSSASR